MSSPFSSPPSDFVLLASALTVDWLLGEPPSALHPVVWMGKVTRAAEKRLADLNVVGQLVAGAGLAVGIPLMFALGAAILTQAGGPFPLIPWLIGVWLVKTTFAVRALGRAARDVRGPLAEGDLPAARDALKGLCSRDADPLDGPALAGATVSSLAENFCDSIVAPLFFFALGGLPAAMFYRAVNTLDAMIGYRGRYEYLGKASARLDDLLNYLPARLSAYVLLAAGKLSGLDARRGYQILQRDGAKTASPNAGRPMAAMAGLLGVALEKEGQYRLGDAGEPLGPETIARAWRVVQIAAALIAVVTLLFVYAFRSGAHLAG